MVVSVKRLFICLSVMNCMFAGGEDAVESSSEKQILVFGGTGFLGTPVVELLLARGDKVTVVSRGNWYWDYEKRILPKVKWIKYDRSASLESSSELASLLETTEWDAVIDITSEWHGPEELETIVNAVKEKTKLYVYISPGIIYDVCNRSIPPPLAEKDAVKPEDEEARVTLERHYWKANKKFLAEQVLHEQRLGGGFPFVVLRLPDVIGPRENRHRLWLYQIWVKVAKKLDFPVLVPDFMIEHKMSFVYSEDVAKSVVKILSLGPQVHDQAINLAYREGINFHTLIDRIGVALGEDEVHTKPFDHSRKPDFYYYPTMHRGVLDVSKAESLLDWEPTDFAEAMKTTVEFHEAAMRDDGHPTQRDEIIQLFIMHHLKGDREQEFIRAVEELYDIKLNHFKKHDEL